MRQADLERALRAVLRDLAPYRSDLILIGGWVPYLYRHYGGFATRDGEDTLTFELDVLVSRPLPAGRRPHLADVLRGARFRPLAGQTPAAVWVRDVDGGEKIEFITSHRGIAQGQGRVVPLPEQPGVGAIPLTEMEVMRSHTRTLLLPPLGESGAVEAQVPTLGAYVVNKALTFLRRSSRTDEAGAPKLAKDLLYLRDLAAAGDDVIAAIREDVEHIAQSAAGDAERLRAGATNLRFVAEGHLRHHLTGVATMVVERAPGASIELEEMRTRGFLLDLCALLLDVADLHSPFESAGPGPGPHED
jgi:hypothetical protein